MYHLEAFDDAQTPILADWFASPDIQDRFGGMIDNVHAGHTLFEGQTAYWAVDEAGDKCAWILIERGDDKNAPLALMTAGENRRQGAAGFLLEQLPRLPCHRSGSCYLAPVEPDNQAAHSCFTKAGFVQEDVDAEGFLNFTKVYEARAC